MGGRFTLVSYEITRNKLPEPRRLPAGVLRRTTGTAPDTRLEAVSGPLGSNRQGFPRSIDWSSTKDYTCFQAAKAATNPLPVAPSDPEVAWRGTPTLLAGFAAP